MLLLFLAQSSFSGSTSYRNLAHQIVGIPLEELTEEDLDTEHAEGILVALRDMKSYRTLFRLNDQETIDLAVEKMRETEGKYWRLRESLRTSKSPYVIDDIAPLLYLEDTAEVRFFHDSFRDMGFSKTIAEIMLTIASEAPEFSEAVRAEASLPGASIERMREWWEANEEALSEERFDDVKPINISLTNKVVAQDFESLADPAIKVPDASEIIKEAATPEPAIEEPAEMVAAKPIEEEVEQSSNWWLWLIGAVIVVGGVGLAVRRKN